ncbi:hypothetical protein GGI26_005029 [Coemansia sp. RSA 1358]|uniref:Metalloenzyme domain-containing protein n=1 Tax=Coemansia umbellata TaxID=1424467 RepID=A0ABQ8PHF9_9FUNG|nr:hypothetical protein EDC05_004736 [Coemansia umbellata]KAJ2620387.1 hypothetical protein GGI26_005029 [Coemansia sp. RSA 1358]
MAQLQELSARYNIILVVASDHAKEVDVPGSTSVFRCKEEGKPHIVRHLATYGPLSGYIDTDPGVVKMILFLVMSK